MKRILCIDGGGIRGIIPARILAEIEKETGKDISSMFDLIVGTSTGAIAASLLCADNGVGEPKYTAGSVTALYRNKGTDIFKHSFTDKLKSGFGLLDQKYSSKPITSVLEQFLGNTTLKQTLTKTMVTTYDIENREAVLLKSWRDEHKDLRLVDCVLASAAAPTYFEPAKLTINKEESYFIDGGVFANNPVLCAIAEAKLLFPKEKNFSVLSLGTGWLENPINGESAKDWGAAEWLNPLLGVLFDGQTHTADYIAGKLVNNYLRVDGSMYLSIDPRLDAADPRNITQLEMFARDLYQERKDEILNFLTKQGEL